MKYNNKIIVKLLEDGFTLEAANKTFERMMDDFYFFYDQNDEIGMNVVLKRNGFSLDYIDCFV